MDYHKGARELVDAILSGNSERIQSSFNYAMALRVDEKLDQMRSQVSKNFFNTKREQSDGRR
jgi:hypothetical protein